MRKQRKMEHIDSYLLSTYEGNPLFSDIYIEPVALSSYDFSEIDTRKEFFGKVLDFPLLINAMTGGSAETEDINDDLARLCHQLNISMATGSQKIIFEEEDINQSFLTVRETAPEAVIFGNLSARESVEEFRKAKELISAQGMQIHLNTVQELIMKEGDREFAHTRENLKKLREELDFPLIIKEIGFGLSKKDCYELYDLGYRVFDIAGHGGTNFAEIENSRRTDEDFSSFIQWGIPTAKILLDLQDRPEDMIVLSSGGITTPLDIVKSFILGADYVAISGEILKYLLYGGYNAAFHYVESLILQTKMLMHSLDCRTLDDLKNVEYKITGTLKELI